mgnify:CR=1 FL=1
MKSILISGGTGLVGKYLQKKLEEKNYRVKILSRSPKNENEFKWNINDGYIDESAFENVSHIIHLAGAGIADKRWTNERKKELINSRVKSANLLFDKIKELETPLKGFISASGIGYYGAVTSDKIFTEDDNVANDFLGEVCKKWEDAAHQFKINNIPVTILRTGIVLSKKEGALEKMRTPIVTPLGSGKQFIPWVHIEDLCQMYINAIELDLTGTYNAVAPEHHTSKSFSKTLAKSLKRPFLPIGVPSFILKLFFGEMAIILLEGSKISSKKIEKNKDYSFRFSKLQKALSNLK